MSFWKEAPGPGWIDCFWSFFSCTGTPICVPIRNKPLAPSPPPPESERFKIVKASPSDSEKVIQFLSSHFTITQDAVCNLSAERLRKGIETNWIVLFAEQNNTLVGTAVSRSLGETQFHVFSENESKLSSYPQTSYIDFFCVHPDYRKTGVGSLLLKYIDYYACEIGRSIHFFQKEIAPLFSIPPIWAGTYISREVGRFASNGSLSFSRVLKKSNPALNGKNDFSLSFHSKDPSEDTRYITNDCGNYKVSLAITNTYHTYKHSLIGEVLFFNIESSGNISISKKNIAAAIEDILDSSGFRYILMDETVPHSDLHPWKKDAPYYIYAYNVNPRRFFSVRPEFWF